MEIHLLDIHPNPSLQAQSQLVPDKSEWILPLGCAYIQNEYVQIQGRVNIQYQNQTIIKLRFQIETLVNGFTTQFVTIATKNNLNKHLSSPQLQSYLKTVIQQKYTGYISVILTQLKKVVRKIP